MTYWVNKAGYPVEPNCVYKKRKWWQPSQHISCHNTYRDAKSEADRLNQKDDAE